MARSPKRSRYYVRVARLRVETAVVEVDAANDEEAERRAVSKAQSSATPWSLKPYDPLAYRPHVETMITGDELDPPVKLDRDQGEEMLADVETHYLLLQTSGDVDEGRIVLQPWFVVDEPDLLASDLARDWIAALQHLGVTHMSERLDDLASGSPPKPSDRIFFSAPRRPKPDDEQN